MPNDKKPKTTPAKKAVLSTLNAKVDKVRELALKSLHEMLTQGKESDATKAAFKKALQDAADSLKP